MPESKLSYEILCAINHSNVKKLCYFAKLKKHAHHCIDQHASINKVLNLDTKIKNDNLPPNK